MQTIILKQKQSSKIWLALTLYLNIVVGLHLAWVLAAGSNCRVAVLFVIFSLVLPASVRGLERSIDRSSRRD